MKPAQFGMVLRQYRNMAGLTQMELAERSSLSVRAVSDMERGRTAPHSRSVRLLAEALGLDEPATERLLAERSRGAAEAGLRELPVLRDGLRHVVPRQLLASVSHFTGRAAELRTLHELLGQAEAGSGAVPIAVVSGAAGVGKTALAVHWAHQVADRFTDGQLYVSLRGLSPSVPRVEPSQVVCGFLAALGVPAGWIPATIGAQAGLLRSVLTGRNILIVADDAQDADQVRPLLPGSSSCCVVVTSRNQLTELVAQYGACLVNIGPLTEAESFDPLSRKLGL
jgi:transcriptional regulator with XRE-family HTH domain